MPGLEDMKPKSSSLVWRDLTILGCIHPRSKDGKYSVCLHVSAENGWKSTQLHVIHAIFIYDVKMYMASS